MEIARLFLAASGPTPMRVVERYANGSGLVECTVLKVGKYDLSKTASTATGEWDVTPDVLKQMAVNFSKLDRPVGVSTHPHKTWEGAKGGPQPAFYEALFVEGNQGDQLRARIWCCAGLLMELEAGMWRGYSVEAAKDRENSSGVLKGWSLFGGVFTNDPGSNVHNRMEMEQVAASASAQIALDVEMDATAPPVTVQALPSDPGPDPTPKEPVTPIRAVAPPEKEARMSEAQQSATISLAAHTDKVAQLEARVATADAGTRGAEARLADANTQVNSLRAETVQLTEEVRTRDQKITELEASVRNRDIRLSSAEKSNREQQVQIATLSTELESVKKSTESDRVVALCTKAIDSGLPPVLFAGYDKDPAAWLASKFATFGSFEDHVTALLDVGPKVPGSVSVTAPVKAGPDPSKADPPKDETVQVTEKEEAVLSHIGGTTFVGVTTEEEARKRFAKK